MSLKQEMKNATRALSDNMEATSALEDEIVELSGALRLYTAISNNVDKVARHISAITESNSAETGEISKRLQEIKEESAPYREQLRSIEANFGPRIAPLEEQERNAKEAIASLQKEQGSFQGNLDNALSEKQRYESEMSEWLKKLEDAQNTIVGGPDGPGFDSYEDRKWNIENCETQFEIAKNNSAACDTIIEQARFNLSQVNSQMMNVNNMLSQSQVALAPIYSERRSATQPVKAKLAPYNAERDALSKRQRALEEETKNVQSLLATAEQVKSNPSLIKSTETTLQAKKDDLNSLRGAVVRQKYEIGKLEDRKADKKTVILTAIAALIASSLFGTPLLTMLLGG